VQIRKLIVITLRTTVIKGRNSPETTAGASMPNLTIACLALSYRSPCSGRPLRYLKYLPAPLKVSTMTNLCKHGVVGLLAAMVLWYAGVPVLAAAPAEVVRLVVDYGDGVQVHFTKLPWKEGMTVVDALHAAQKHPRGIKFSQRGTAANAMISEIGGQKNEGSGKNWLFSVGGKTADLGAGAYELKAGDTILWEFKDYDYN